MKEHIRCFVNKKHDVETAQVMKTELESHGRLRGCRVAVPEIDKSEELHEGIIRHQTSAFSIISSTKHSKSEYGKAYDAGWAAPKRAWCHKANKSFTIKSDLSGLSV